MEIINGKYKPFDKPVFVTKPLLPDVESIYGMVKDIWSSGHVTNNGRFCRELESELKEYFGEKDVSVFSSGTVALQLACRILRLSGEVITTPFTFAATPHSLFWNNIKPVFCDIEETSMNLDPSLLEMHITDKTTAILPVHVFGMPCRTAEINNIAAKYNIKVLYDAAHAFGVELEGMPIGNCGDISMFSFHATKIFHTLEGGALVFNSGGLKERADVLRNFGIIDGEQVIEPGTNGKISEIQCAVGVLLLGKIEEEIAGRKRIAELYRSLLKGVPGIFFNKDCKGVRHNYSYFVIRIDKTDYGMDRDELFESLKRYNIFARRYFYPLCSSFSCYRDLPSALPGNLPVAERISRQVLSLPIYGRMEDKDVERICGIINQIRGE